MEINGTNVRRLIAENHAEANTIARYDIKLCCLSTTERPKMGGWSAGFVACSVLARCRCWFT